MHHEHARTDALDGVVISDEACERDVTLLVFDGFSVDGRAHGHAAT